MTRNKIIKSFMKREAVTSLLHTAACGNCPGGTNVPIKSWFEPIDSINPCECCGKGFGDNHYGKRYHIIGQHTTEGTLCYFIYLNCLKAIGFATDKK